MKASANWGEFQEPLESGWTKSPVERTVDDVNEAVDSFNKMANVINKVADWFANLKTNISELTADLLLGSYSLITDVVLHTPVFLFDNEWFKSNIVTFTGLSVFMVILVSMYESMQRMLSGLLGRSNHQHTDMTRITKMLPLALLGSAIAPLGFLYGFKALNWLTNMILDVGKINMQKSIDNLNLGVASWLEVSSFIAFDIALIVFLVPVLLQNFRRWADLACCFLITPIALGCKVFKSLEHYHTAWWNHIKACSLTQLYYSVFIVLLGTLMFGFAPADTFMALLIKVGLVVGGLSRLSTPPSIFGRSIDKGKDITDVYSDFKKATRAKDVKNVAEKSGDMIYEKIVPKHIKFGVNKLIRKRKDLL